MLTNTAAVTERQLRKPTAFFSRILYQTVHTNNRMAAIQGQHGLEGLRNQVFQVSVLVHSIMRSLDQSTEYKATNLPILWIGATSSLHEKKSLKYHRSCQLLAQGPSLAHRYFIRLTQHFFKACIRINTLKVLDFSIFNYQYIWQH